MSDIAFDIETGDLPREVQEQRCKPFVETPFVDEPYKDFSAGNAKKPETVAAKRAEWWAAKQAWESSVDERRKAHEAAGQERRKAHYDEKLAKARLKAHQSQILCVSFYDGTGDGDCWWADGNEYGLLTTVLARINDTLRAGDRVIGANVLNFDVPYIYRRALLHGLTTARLVSIGYGGRHEIHKNVVDVLKVYQGPEWGSIPPLGLDALANCFGIQGKTETAGGAKFQELAETDRARAERYAIQDSKVAWEIAVKMGLATVPTQLEEEPF